MTEAQMTIMQWLSPAFPTGAFAYSHGLEAAVEMGAVRDSATLTLWLRDVLWQGSGRCDVVWLRLAHKAETISALHKLDAEARAFAPSRTRRDEAVRQGAAFARTLREIWGLEVPDVVLPLAVGAGTRTRGLEIETVIPLYLQGFTSNIVAAAQRLLPIGQIGGQTVLAELQRDCIGVARKANGRDALFSNAFVSDIAAMRQEHLGTRIFQS